jgi:hypothetical protein
MVLGILAIGLQQVVIDVLDRHVGSRPVKAERVQLEHHHGAGRVLGERLVDAQCDLVPGRHGAGDQVSCDQFLGDVVPHDAPPVRILDRLFSRGL